MRALVELWIVRDLGSVRKPTRGATLLSLLTLLSPYRRCGIMSVAQDKKTIACYGYLRLALPCPALPSPCLAFPCTCLPKEPVTCYGHLHRALPCLAFAMVRFAMLCEVHAQQNKTCHMLQLSSPSYLAQATSRSSMDVMADPESSDANPAARALANDGPAQAAAGAAHPAEASAIAAQPVEASQAEPEVWDVRGSAAGSAAKPAPAAA